ncbi:ABC transporter, permease protein [Campylobacter iguaniorum]|uniref:ABC transporter, permease protein n=1 Tax=Campylobacter iguaniorum TaxID=1244531 RepID=A0A076FAZ9_9BACT|nr:FtsX-like permease family protein [Campylobacter iguaniorum]AII14833.1 ABC transporter, permease protein [Campylobacter iguaniorum]ALV24621.1 ABC transporter, permease protein [Campylobacter iguaniorum]
MISKNFIDYSITLLFKDKADHSFSFLIFSFIVFLLSSVLFISDSIKYDITNSIKSRPDIVVEALRAGKDDLIHDGYIYDISQISGVGDIQGIVDGMYYFGQKRVWFHIIGDENLDEYEMIIGSGVKEAMQELYYEDVFNFLTEKQLIPIKINKISPHETNIVSNDVIYMNPQTARDVLSIDAGKYTKLYVSVPNQNEVSEVALKIANLYPNTVATSAEDAVAAVNNLYYYKGGIFMILYVVAMVSFFILLKNQISLVYGEKKKEIAILRSIGFCIKDIIALKFIQNIVVSTAAYLLGIALAYIYVFVANAPLLRNIFLGSELNNSITFTPVIDFDILFLIFIFSVIPFLAFVIIPSWRVAISDMSEAVK